MTKSALLIKMIDLLRSNPGMTVDELANALDRSERTIYRWLNEISVDLKTPLYCEDGGYYLTSGLEDKVIDISPQELLALRLSLKSSPFMDGSPIKKYAESAWVKIRDAAPCGRLEKLSDLAATHSVDVTTSSANTRPEIVEMLDAAVSERRRVHVIYRSQKSEAIKSYTIDPYAVVFRRHSWYVVSYSHEHGKVIQLKLARFLSVMDSGHKFNPPKDFSVEKYFQYSWEAWGGSEPTRVRIRFSPKVAKIIQESQRHPTQVLYPQEDGGVIFEVTVSGIHEIAFWILGYGKEADVIEPANLREYILDQARGILYRDADKIDLEDELLEEVIGDI